MPGIPADLLSQLIALIDRLRDESAGFRETHDDQQQWYNRGYANGMVAALVELGYADALGDRQPDDPAWLAGNEVMAWGKAYRHGEQMGRRETLEITGAGTD